MHATDNPTQHAMRQRVDGADGTSLLEIIAVQP